MSNFIPLLLLLSPLAALVDEVDVDVELSPPTPDDELLLELLEPTGTVVFTGSVMSGNPSRGFPQAPSQRATATRTDG